MTDPILDRRTVLRRGIRVLWRAIRTHPAPFTVSVSGATLFATMSVGATIVLGRVTDELIVPAFETKATGQAMPRRGARHHGRGPAPGDRCRSAGASSAA